MSEFTRALAQNKFFLLDGAMGTMLQKSGLPAGESPERFCLKNPQVLHKIHTAYVNAGSDILTTCTFGGSPFKLPSDLDLAEFNYQMARVAKDAAQQAQRPVFVAGNLGPTGRFCRPLGDLEPLDLINGYRAQVRALVRGGVDLIFIETQFDLAEVRAAVIAAKQECDLPIMASMTFEDAVSLTGATPEIFAETMQNLGVTVLGTNCSAGPDQMCPVIAQLLSVAQVPVMVEPNAGLPELVDGATVFRLQPEDFATKTVAFAAQGVQILGGCCGTTPEHIAALKHAVTNLPFKKAPVVKNSCITLTTRSHLVRIGQDYPLALIGERINPTGKKALTADLQAGVFGTALRFADEQVAAGAALLDVNVGAPLVDETQLLPELVLRLTERVSVPLSLDSSHVDAIAKALPYCPGSALVNSISGESGRMEALGALCRDFGAPFILLPLKGRTLPVRASERIAIIEELLAQADALGIPRRLIMVDVLALAVSSKAEAGHEGLKTIAWCTAQGIPTTIGLSNVSFGLPARELLNATFLSLGVGAGLCSCISNPSSPRVREVRDASNALLCKDPNAARFIAQYAEWSHGDGGHGQTGAGNTPVSTTATTLDGAVIQGDKENVTALVEQALADGADPFSLVQEVLIPAITEVGARYERKEFFLPQLIRSAETMQTAFARLKPLLEAQRGSEKRPVIVLATVEGDIHDIGKNIVALLLGNHGFDVVDAGKDVKADDIIHCALEHDASIIGLSALMTTTMVRMEDTIQLIKAKQLPFKVMVGGAVVTQAFADAICADGYSTDAVGAVRVAKALLN